MKWRDMIGNDQNWRALSGALAQTNTVGNSSAQDWQQSTTGVTTVVSSICDGYRNMIRSRMQWPHATSAAFSNTLGIGRFSFLDCVPIEGCRVVVFAVIDGKDVILYDDESLFPSDTLITQLRLLEG